MVQNDQVHSISAGNSLPVPNVQALSASLNGSSQITERYIRPESIADSTRFVCRDKIELPIIDLAKLEDPAFSCQEAARLDPACKEWGFFQLVNHEVPENLIKQLKVDLMEFFNMPLEEKKAYQQQAGDLQGYGQAFVHSDEQKLDWADLLYLATRPITDRKLMLWPTSPSTFRDTTDRYSLEITRVAECLFDHNGRNIKKDDDVSSCASLKDGVK